MTERLFGYRRDTSDERDRPFAMVRERLSSLAVTPSGDEYRIPLHRGPKDQIGSSCTANAITGALECISDLSPRPLPVLSAHGLYWCERFQMGEPDRDEGAMLRTGAYVLSRFGVAASETCPQSDATLFTQPDPAYFMGGSDHRIDGYYRINAGALDDIETAVRANHPVVFGVEVGHDFAYYSGDPSVVFDAPATALGAHAMYVVGVRGFGDAREWLVRTSWGAWGLDGQGLAWISSSYLASAWDLWCLTRSS